MFSSSFSSSRVPTGNSFLATITSTISGPLLPESLAVRMAATNPQPMAIAISVMFFDFIAAVLKV